MISDGQGYWQGKIAIYVSGYSIILNQEALNILNIGSSMIYDNERCVLSGWVRLFHTFPI